MLSPQIERALAHVGSSRVTIAQMRALIAAGDGGSYAVAIQTTGLTSHRCTVRSPICQLPSGDHWWSGAARGLR